MNTITIDGHVIPRFIYGTAWKEDETQRLVELAIQQGFRGIDTANQRKHYHEAGVGEAIRNYPREELFLQTKFTFQAGQDHRLPYDPAAPIANQVEQSFASSLEHLHVAQLDSYVLHGPSGGRGLQADDWEAWHAMEAIQQSGKTRWLGVSNVNLAQLEQLCKEAKTPPRFVQNRCFAVHGWDRDIRNFCNANEIYYQGFSLLTANAGIFRSQELAEIAQRHQRTFPQIVFRFALQVGMLPLTGTTNAEHMKTDLDVFDFELSEEEVTKIETIAG